MVRGVPLFSKSMVVEISGRLVRVMVPSLVLNLKEPMRGCKRRVSESIMRAIPRNSRARR